MLKDELNVKQQTNGNGTSTNTYSNGKSNQNQADNQNSKDRTLFCVNIDQKCTEDILYELFLQAGPIENIVRKADRNGTLICLITYKHIESCDYAIKIFNGISLFNQPMKVQFCQNSSNNNQLNSNSRQNSQTSVNNYQHLQNNQSGRIHRQSSITENFQSQQNRHSPQSPANNIGSLMAPPNLIQFMMQSFNQNSIPGGMGGNFEFGTPNQFQNNNVNFNRSRSGSNIQEDERFHQSRRFSGEKNNFDSNNRGYSSSNSRNRRNDYNSSDNMNTHSDFNQRDFDPRYNKQSSRSRDNRMNNNRSRSRSPIRKRK